MKQEVFVIMPFSKTPTRNRDELTAFFNRNIKTLIEAAPIGGVRFKVRRSEDAFNINEQVIRDLYAAHVVIADLSGTESNPNVMYELGLRLAVSNKPVILIREAHPENRDIFDVAGFHTFAYDPARPTDVEDYLVNKLVRFATGDEEYYSPVLSVLEQEPSVVRRIESDRLQNRLTAASHTIYDLRRGMIPRIVAFCSQKIDVAFSKDVAEFQNQFDAHFEQLMQLDWSAADIRVRPNPAILGLVAEPPDPKLIGGEHYKAFSAYINQFFTELFTFDEAWSFRQVGLLIGEGPLLEDLVDAIKYMLSEEDVATRHGKREFRRLLGKSNFHWHVAIQHFFSLPDENEERFMLSIPQVPGVLDTFEQTQAVIEGVFREPHDDVQSLFVAIEQALRDAGAADEPLELLLENIASQLNVRRTSFSEE